MDSKREWQIARCTTAGCRWMEAFDNSKAATEAGQYHCRRERHHTFNIAPYKDLLDVVQRSIEAIERAGGTPEAA